MSPFGFTGLSKPDPAIVPFVPYAYPEAARHLFVAWILCHRSIQISGRPVSKAQPTVLQRSLEYKQKAIQIINHDLNNEETKTGDEVLFGVCCVAAVEVSPSYNFSIDSSLC